MPLFVLCTQLFRSLDVHYPAFDISDCAGHLPGGGLFGDARNGSRAAGL